MTRYTLCALVLGLCAAAPAATAQQAAPTKLAYVNVRAVLQQTPEYEKAESLFTRGLDGYRAQVAKMQAQLDSASAEFEQQSVLLSPSARNAKRKELEDKAAQCKSAAPGNKSRRRHRVSRRCRGRET